MNGISKAINQKKFTSIYHKGIISIFYIANLIKGQNNHLFKSRSITIQQYNLLRILRGSSPNPCSIGILKERMMDKMSDASRLVDRLVILGLAERIENSVDRRAVDVHITQKGMNILSDLDKHQKEFEKALTCLSTKELDTLMTLLDKVIDASL